jgi:nucleotide-binding universal stress UspA family protein
VQHLARILAAIDFSNPARRAYDYALALASRHKAELVVVQAVPADLPFDRQGRQRRTLETRLQRMAAEAQVDFGYRVQAGDPAEIILLHAGAIRPDVIVLGSHQRRGLERVRLGSVSERVVAKAGVPVLVVPARLRRSATGAFRHIAVAVDLKASRDAAVEQALDVASDTAERVTLLHAVPGSPQGVPLHLLRYGQAEFERQLVRDARRGLQRAVPVDRRSPAAVHTRLLRGDTATAVTGALTTLGADLLVVGVRPRGLVARSLFGSTAARLAKVIDVPMLAVPVAAGRGEPDAQAGRRRAA